MRWPSANLEEKHEPRGVSVAEAQNGDSMKSFRPALDIGRDREAVIRSSGRLSFDRAVVEQWTSTLNAPFFSRRYRRSEDGCLHQYIASSGWAVDALHPVHEVRPVTV